RTGTDERGQDVENVLTLCEFTVVGGLTALRTILRCRADGARPVESEAIDTGVTHLFGCKPLVAGLGTVEKANAVNPWYEVQPVYRQHEEEDRHDQREVRSHSPRPGNTPLQVVEVLDDHLEGIPPPGRNHHV